MTNPTDNEWSRFLQIREDLSKLPPSEVPTRIEALRREGESRAVISMVESDYCPAQQPELRPGRRLANRYTVKRKIAEGGMGVVYEAVQELTQQKVALKVIHPTKVSPSLMNRFREEIRTLGKLQHDHIVHIFDADYDRENPATQDLLFYVMQLVEGLPLMRWVEMSRPTFEARLECFIQVCEAVHYAHRHSVIHRDLKPDNILVDAAGRPAILDFGLAQIMDLASDAPEGRLSSEGRSVIEIAGTPDFMSPERWEGDPGGVPADVFALGVILHQMLTGTRPWNVAPNASSEELRRAICNFSPDEVKPHRALNRPLVHLLGSMLAPDPAARPASAAAVETAIRAIVARRRLKRRIRRAAPIWASAAVAVGSVVATRSYYAWLKNQAWKSERQMVQASQMVRQRSRVDTLDQVIKLLPEKPALRHSQDQWRDVVLEAMATWNLRSRRAVQLPNGFDPCVGDLQGTRFFGRSTAGAWELIERVDGAWVPTRFPGQRDCLRARINPRRPQVAALQPDGSLVVWQWNQNQQTNLLPSAEAATQFEFSPDGRYLACSVSIAGSPEADRDRLSAVRIFDTETWKAVALLFKPRDQPESGTFLIVRSRPIAGLAFSPDGELLATWSDESSYLLVWRWSEEQLLQFPRHTDRLAAAAWRPRLTQPELAAIQADGQIRVWRLSSTSNPTANLNPGDAVVWGQALHTFRGQLAWAADGEALAAVDELRQTMDIFAPNAGTGGFRVPLGNPGGGGMRWFCSGLVRSREGRREWVPFDSEPPVRRILKLPNLSPSHLAFNPAGTILAAADNTRIVFVATTSSATLASKEMPLSGPIAFDAASGDLWAYNKTNGPIRWTASASQDVLNYMPVDQAALQSPVGQLAANGGNLVFSRGTDIFVIPKGGAFPSAKASPDIVVDAPPQQLAISASGRRVGAIWWNPLRADLWRWQANGKWVLELTITNAPVLAHLPEWNRDAPLTIPPRQQRTDEERALNSQSGHIGDPILFTPAMQIPMVAWLLDSEQGVHLDYLAPECCIHVATLPFDREHGAPTAMALSPCGMRLATANSKGEIHIWDLRRTLSRLAELRLGIDQIDLEKAGQGVESPKSLTITGPG